MKIQIEEYEDLKNYIELFKKNTIEILIIEGNPGIGKTQIVKEVFKDTSEIEYCWIDGRITAPIFYEKLYQYRDCPIILDDCDSLYKDKQSLELLKSLCNTSTQDKKVSWNIKRKLTLSDDPTIELPSSFYTGSTVLILCNQWKSTNTHISSIEDRGILLNFIPGIHTIHIYAQGFIKDIEVWNFIGKYLHLTKNISLRIYKIAEDIKRDTVFTNPSRTSEERTRTHNKDIYKSPMESWKHITLQSLGLTREDILVIQLEEDNRYPTIQQKSIVYSGITNKSMRTYWRKKKELKI